jgi:hypothetical protein
MLLGCAGRHHQYQQLCNSHLQQLQQFFLLLSLFCSWPCHATRLAPWPGLLQSRDPWQQQVCLPNGGGQRQAAAGGQL